MNSAPIPAVMGRAAAMVTTLLLAAVGVAQLAGVDVSMAVEEASDGNMLGTAWGTAFALGGALILWARLTSDVYRAIALEIGSSVCAAAGVLAYAWTIFDRSEGWPVSGTVTLTFCLATVINLTGRSALLAAALVRWRRAFQ